MTDDTRAEFERWAMAEDYDCEWLNGRYPSLRTGGAWAGWQAAIDAALAEGNRE